MLRASFPKMYTKSRGWRSRLYGKYVYVYWIVDYTVDGVDSMINMCDCAWSMRDDAPGGKARNTGENEIHRRNWRKRITVLYCLHKPDNKSFQSYVWIIESEKYYTLYLIKSIRQTINLLAALFLILMCFYSGYKKYLRISLFSNEAFSLSSSTFLKNNTK